MKESEADNKVAVLAAVTEDGIPLVTLGVSKAAWEYMKDGKSHTFDLTAAGIPLRLIMFGGETKAGMIESLRAQGEAWGLTVNDGPPLDFGIKNKPTH